MKGLRLLLKQSPVSPAADPEVMVKDDEPMTVEQYVADVLTHSPEVTPEELVTVTAEMFGVSAEYVKDLINHKGKRGRKRKYPYAPRSLRTLCPLCGRQNAEMNKLHMVLEAYQSQPGITIVDWLREVLT